LNNISKLLHSIAKKYRYGDHFFLLDRGISAHSKIMDKLLFPHGKSPAAEKFRSLTMNCRTIVVEDSYVDMDFQACYARFYYLRHHDVPRRCIRLHFFDTVINANQMLALPSRIKKRYRGFIILRPLESSYLGRAILSAKLLDNLVLKNRYEMPYLTCKATYHVSLAGNELEINGVPWIQQDKLVSACASASIWVAGCFMSHGYGHQFNLFSTVDITDLANSISGSRSMPSEGLIPPQMLYALRKMGYEPILRAPESVSHAKRISYHHIESSLPVIVSIYVPGKGGHAVTAVGHTLNRKLIINHQNNEDASTFYKTSDFATALIIQDDAYGPFRLMELVDPTYIIESADYKEKWSRLKCLDSSGNMKSEIRKSFLSQFRCAAIIDRETKQEEIAFVKAFMIPLPSGVTVDGLTAENRAIAFFSNWLKLQKQDDSNLIIRTFLCPSNMIKATWEDRDVMPMVLARMLRSHLMSKWVWVTQISGIEHFIRHTNKAYGQLIQDGGSHPAFQQYTPELSRRGIILFNMPGVLLATEPDGDLHIRKIDYKSMPAYTRAYQA
jgi:hypothetical protein